MASHSTCFQICIYQLTAFCFAQQHMLNTIFHVLISFLHSCTTHATLCLLSLHTFQQHTLPLGPHIVNTSDHDLLCSIGSLNLSQQCTLSQISLHFTLQHCIPPLAQLKSLVLIIYNTENDVDHYVIHTTQGRTPALIPILCRIGLVFQSHNSSMASHSVQDRTGCSIS